jgi:hypothetical protein
MINKSNCKTLAAVFSLILIFSIGTLAGTGGKSKNYRKEKPNCAKMSDAAIVRAIYAKIKVRYASQRRHINVRIKDNIVTLEGWTTSKSSRLAIENYARKTNCVKDVVNKLGSSAGLGCGPGQKECGDICISEKESCNIVGR